MSIVVYKCTVCERTVERKLNKTGLSALGSCIITQGCKGKLTVESTKPGYNIPLTTEYVPNLNDWEQRKALYTHSQEIPTNVWYIKHNLNNVPLVYVYLFDQTNETLVQTTNFSFNVVDNNNITVSFDQDVFGVVQCIARSQQTNKQLTKTEPINTIQMSVNSKLVVAIPSNVVDLTGSINYLSPSTNQYVTAPILMTDDLTNTAWDSALTVLINGKHYTLYSINITEIPDSLISITLNDINANMGYVLLSALPHSVVDRINNKTIKISSILDTDTTALSVFNSDILCNASNIVNIYPQIKVIS